MELYLSEDEPLKVAVLYAAADRDFGEELVRQFRTLGPAVRVWHPELIEAGEPAAARGCESVELAGVVLALISVSFMNDPICLQWLAHACAQRERSGARVAPVRLRSVAGNPPELRGLQMLPREGKPPIAALKAHEREEAWVEIVHEVRAHVRALHRPKEIIELFQDVLRFCRLDQEAGGARVEHTEKVIGPPLWQIAEVIAVKPGKPKAALLVAAVKGTPGEAHLTALRPLNHAHRRRHPFAIAHLVYDGAAPADDLVSAAYEEGIAIVGIAEHQRLIDVEPYIDRLRRRLARDPLYPPALYVTQRGEWLRGDGPPITDVLARLEETLLCPEQRFVVVLGDFGTGKTFLLKRLAARLGQRGKPPYPVLIEMRALEKVHSVDALAAQHFAFEGQPFFPEAFRAMLRVGQIALLFDGFDELALRVRYARAAEHLEMLIGAAEGKAKVVLTSRTQHFASDQQVRTALAERADRVPGREMLKLRAFDHDQIEQFLQNKLVNVAQASARVKLLDQVKDLLGLSANPRMLSFIAELPEEELLKARDRNQEITAASLYRRLLDYWFGKEDERLRLHNETDKLRPEERWRAVEALALCLWGRTERLLDVRELPEEVGRVLGDLSARDLDRDIAGHLVGSATLLVREGEGRFSFLHQSVMEWLVANAAAAVLKGGGAPDMLEKGEMSPLMADFFSDLAPAGKAVEWAKRIVEGTARDAAKRNALLVLRRAGVEALRANYRGKDLRGQDFSGQDLTNADFTDADLSEARLVGTKLAGAILRNTKLLDAAMEGAVLSNADLTGADLSRARLTGAELSGATLDGALLYRAKLAGARHTPASLASARSRFGASIPPLSGAQAMNDVAASRCNSVALWGDLLASGNKDGTVRLWDRASGLLLRVLAGHTAAVLSVAFSPDGLTLASGSADASVRLVDLSSGGLVRSLDGHTDSVNSVTFSPDGLLLATGSDDRSIRVWDLAGGALLRSLQGHSYSVNSVAFSPDGRTLASGSYDTSVRLWDPASGKLLHSLEGHSDSVNSVAFSPDGRTLASCSYDRSIRLWSLASGKLLSSLEGHSDSVWSVVFSPDGRAIASGSYDASVRLWEPSFGKLLRSLQGHSGWVQAVGFSADGKTLASGSSDTSVRLWDLSSGERLRTLQGHSNAIWSVAFSPDGNTLASGSGDTSVCLWSAASGVLLRSLESRSHSVNSVAFSPDGGSLVSGSTDKSIRFWNPSSGELLRSVQGHASQVLSVCFSADGLTLASSSEDLSIGLWSAASGKLLRSLKGHSDAINSVAFSPDGKTLASGSSDASVRLWDPSSGDLLGTLKGHSYWVTSVAFSPGGKTLASGSSDTSVRLWDLSSGKRPRSLQGHSGSIWCVAFDPAGKTLASGSADKSVRFWDVASGELLRSAEGHSNAVWSIAFHASGRYLAAACADGTIHLWRVADATRMAILYHGAEGWVAYKSDGRYRCGGDLRGSFWHVIGLCRYEVGELDPYIPGLRMADDEPFLDVGDRLAGC